MALPRDASIEHVAEAFGTIEQLHQLTPEALRLTRGQMLALAGFESSAEAARVLAAGWTPPNAYTVYANARSAGLDLTIEDVQSLQYVFSERLPAAEREAIAVTSISKQVGLKSELAVGDINIYCCCCPCCCATAVLDPVEPAVA